MTKRHGVLGRALAVTLTAGVAFGLAGCGDEPSGFPYSSKGSAVQGAGNDVPLTRDEIISAAYTAAMEAGSAHLAMTAEGQASTSAEGDVSYDGGRSAIRMTMSMPQMGEGKIEMRLVDQIMYMQFPGVTPSGKFVAIDPKDQSSPLAKTFSGLTDQMDPLASMKSMESAVTSADRVGEEMIGGAPVDHYRVAVDTAQMMKTLKQPTPEGMPKSLTYDLWLDDGNLIRKMFFDVSDTSVEMLMSKWGQPVKVERPADRDIVKAPGA